MRGGNLNLNICQGNFRIPGRFHSLNLIQGCRVVQHQIRRAFNNITKHALAGKAEEWPTPFQGLYFLDLAALFPQDVYPMFL
jgi:hypothetical protein